MNSNNQLMYSLHIHNSYAGNGNHRSPLIALVMLTKKECCNKLSLVLTKGKREDCNTVKNYGDGQITVAFTITKINHLVVGLFYYLVRPFSVHICVVKCLAALYALFLAKVYGFILIFLNLGFYYF